MPTVADALPVSTLLHEQHREVCVGIMGRILDALWTPPLGGMGRNRRELGLGVDFASGGNRRNCLGEVNSTLLLRGDIRLLSCIRSRDTAMDPR